VTSKTYLNIIIGRRACRKFTKWIHLDTANGTLMTTQIPNNYNHMQSTTDVSKSVNVWQ